MTTTETAAFLGPPSGNWGVPDRFAVLAQTGILARSG
jgi:hypothetical protein